MSRHVVITGGSMGIGLAVSRELALQGARVTILAREATALAAALDDLPGGGHRAYAIDVSDETAWPLVGEQLGPVDGLVCAAAVLGPIGRIGDYAAVEFRRTLEINVSGLLLTIQHCLAALRESRGAIVTFSGGGGTAPLPRYDAYAASKAAVVRLSENLAGDLRHDGVRLNCVAPGFIATRLHEATLQAGPGAVGEEYFERTRHGLATGGDPAQAAVDLVCFLLGGELDVPFTGKLISAQWDPWREAEFRERLANDRDLATLRRIDDMAFAPTERA